MSTIGQEIAERDAAQARREAASATHWGATEAASHADAERRREVADQEAKMNSMALYTLLAVIGIALIGLLTWYFSKPAILAQAPAPVLNRMPTHPVPTVIAPVVSTPTAPSPSASTAVPPPTPTPTPTPVIVAPVIVMPPAPGVPITATQPVSNTSVPTPVAPGTSQSTTTSPTDPASTPATTTPSTNAADTTNAPSTSNSANPQTNSAGTGSTTPQSSSNP